MRNRVRDSSSGSPTRQAGNSACSGCVVERPGQNLFFYTAIAGNCLPTGGIEGIKKFAMFLVEQPKTRMPDHNCVSCNWVQKIWYQFDRVGETMDWLPF